MNTLYVCGKAKDVSILYPRHPHPVISYGHSSTIGNSGAREQLGVWGRFCQIHGAEIIRASRRRFKKCVRKFVSGEIQQGRRAIGLSGGSRAPNKPNISLET